MQEYVAEVIGGGYIYNPVEKFNTIGAACQWAKGVATTGKCVIRTRDGKVVFEMEICDERHSNKPGK